MSFPIFDLHCDLLGCVEGNLDVLDFESPGTNCSIPQLLAGGVKVQTLAVAVITGAGSTKKTERQVRLYEKLLREFPDQVAPFKEFERGVNALFCLFAIENASGLAEEDEPLEKAFERFDLFSNVEKILYVSLTWNGENRFGGGNQTSIGLKPDGKALLEYLSGKGVAIDLSHTSDALAYDILNTIDSSSLDLPVMASHSNYRTIQAVSRNLPDELAKEVIRREGIIGLNFVRRFVGESPSDFLSHLHHGLKLGGEGSIAMGADFYGGFEMPEDVLKDLSFPTFLPGFDNSSCYPQFLSLIEGELSKDQIEKLTYKNVEKFVKGLALPAFSSSEVGR